MIICEYGFDTPDPDNPEFSLREVDFYAWIPRSFWDNVKNHRLNLRKNLKTGLFQVYRHYHSGGDEVVFEGSFEEALRFANNEWNKFLAGWAGKLREPDVPCKHKPPIIDRFFCPYAKK